MEVRVDTWPGWEDDKQHKSVQQHYEINISNMLSANKPSTSKRSANVLLANMLSASKLSASNLLATVLSADTIS